jgi:hypothetical protein
MVRIAYYGHSPNGSSSWVPARCAGGKTIPRKLILILPDIYSPIQATLRQKAAESVNWAVMTAEGL